jgi:hypothetical protein
MYQIQFDIVAKPPGKILIQRHLNFEVRYHYCTFDNAISDGSIMMDGPVVKEVHHCVVVAWVPWIWVVARSLSVCKTVGSAVWP